MCLCSVLAHAEGKRARGRSVVCEDAPLCFHMQILNKKSTHLCFLSFLSLGCFAFFTIFYRFPALWSRWLFFLDLAACNLLSTDTHPGSQPSLPGLKLSSCRQSEGRRRKLQIPRAKFANQSCPGLGRSGLLWLSYRRKWQGVSLW